jgi:hypothetical protein
VVCGITGKERMLPSYNLSDNGTISAVVSPESNGYDGTGAMWFVILVILVYGVAVVGVFVFNFYKRSSNDHDELDRQAITYIKNIDSVRKSMEKRNRLDYAQHFIFMFYFLISNFHIQCNYAFETSGSLDSSVNSSIISSTVYSLHVVVSVESVVHMSLELQF